MKISRASLQCKSGLIVWIKVFHAKEEMVSFLTASIDFRHASRIGLGFWGFFWGHQHKYTVDFAMFFPTSIPAVFLEKIANWPQEICHSLAGTASGEEAVRAAGTWDARRQLCRTAPLPQGELLFLQIPSLPTTSKKLFRHSSVFARTHTQLQDQVMNCGCWGTSLLSSYSNYSGADRNSYYISIVVTQNNFFFFKFSKATSDSTLEQKTCFGWRSASQYTDCWRHRGCVQAQNTHHRPWNWRHHLWGWIEHLSGHLWK